MLTGQMLLQDKEKNGINKFTKNFSLEFIEQMEPSFSNENTQPWTDGVYNVIIANNDNVDADFVKKHKDRVNKAGLTKKLLRRMTLRDSGYKINPKFFEGKDQLGFDVDFIREFKDKIEWNTWSYGYDIRTIFDKCPKEFKEQFQEIYDAKTDEYNKKCEQDNRAWRSVMSSVPPDATGLD